MVLLDSGVVHPKLLITQLFLLPLSLKRAEMSITWLSDATPQHLIVQYMKFMKI